MERLALPDWAKEYETSLGTIEIYQPKGPILVAAIVALAACTFVGLIGLAGLFGIILAFLAPQTASAMNAVLRGNNWTGFFAGSPSKFTDLFGLPIMLGVVWGTWWVTKFIFHALRDSKYPALQLNSKEITVGQLHLPWEGIRGCLPDKISTRGLTYPAVVILMRRDYFLNCKPQFSLRASYRDAGDDRLSGLPIGALRYPINRDQLLELITAYGHAYSPFMQSELT